MSCKKYVSDVKSNSKLKVAMLSGIAILGIAVGAVATSCSGIFWKSTAQIVVSDADSTLADQSFSESIYDGLRNFYTHDLQIPDVPVVTSSEINEGNGLWKRPGSDDRSRISTYENIKNEGSNIVIASGFNQQTALQMVSSTDQKYESYKKNLEATGFIFVDGLISRDYNGIQSNPTNIASVAYRADEGSFLVGLSTAVFLNKNWQFFAESRPATLGVSGFVGLALPSTISYLNGFRQGIAYWNKLTSIINLQDGKPGIPIEWISPDQNESNAKPDAYEIKNFATNSFDANSQQAIVKTTSLIKAGAKVIFPIAGPQTQLVVNKIVQEKQNVCVIGVDTEQENITNLQHQLVDVNNPGKSQNIIPFSSLKQLAYSTQNILNAIKNGGEYKGYQGFGYNNIADLSNGGVGISKAGYQYLIDPLFFTQNPKGQSTGAIAQPDESIPGIKTYDLSTLLTSGTTKWNLEDLQFGSESTTIYDNIYNNYKEVLSGKSLIKYNPQETLNWKINGNELNTGFAPYLLPIKGSGSIYNILEVFGATATTQLVAQGQLLNGTKWTYELTK